MTLSQDERVSRFSSSQVWATFALGCSALLITGVQPVALGALIEADIVDLRGAGQLATIEAFTLSVGVIVATIFLPPTALRKVGLLCSLGLCLTNFASAVIDSYALLAVSRALAGLAGGALLWVVTSVLVRTQRPERLAGYFMAGYTTCQALVVLSIALFFMPALGWRGCYIAIAMVISISALLSQLLPSSLKPLPSKDASHKLDLSPAVMITGAIIFIQMIMTVAIWAFIEPIGRIAGLEAQEVQLIISVSLVVQLAGAALAGFLAPRLPAAATLLLLTALILAVSVYLLMVSQFPTSFFMLAAFIFSFAWMFILPFQTKIALDVDPTGRVALIVPFLQLMAGAVAPITAGAVAGEGVASDVAWLSIICACLCGILLVWMVVDRLRSNKPSQ
ncbi:MFS transporter [Parasphingorhabdus litoris]|uniref:hypothetical protein n=1 Tax=Parasphingorhabdus litoris TaxID=394733 RepID=UPI001E3DF16D|nr:hypothetical protein [Parasphingorhabdus litoris]